MAETVGLVLAVGSIFNNLVEDFRYLQLARGFESSYGTALIRLSNAELRFARWGTSIGLTKTEIVDVEVGIITGLKQNMQRLDSLFQKARRKSQQYDCGSGGLAKESLSQPTSKEDERALVLHNAMSKLSLQYVHPVTVEDHPTAGSDGTPLAPNTEPVKERKRDYVRRKSHEIFHSHGPSQREPAVPMPNVIKKARWALFDKQTFEEDINNITAILNDLESLFPAAKLVQQQLAVNEVNCISTKIVREIVDRLAESEGARDKMLEDALKAAKTASEPVATSYGSVSPTNTATGNGKVMQGGVFGDVTMY